MRKYIRDNITALLGTVSEGLAYVGDTGADGVLSDCGAALAAVADTLATHLSGKRYAWYEEKLEQAVSAILAYSDVGDLGSALAQINLCTDALEREREVLTEIAFFPYKAAMWDSLESVWRAAASDPSCAATVVPIPYYEVDSATGKTTEHYEGALYPPDVPITGWQEYDLALMRPDIAYIHNVYDEHNLVTSVHPDYYSHALKKHVTSLVYIPYFASNCPPVANFVLAAVNAAADIIIASSKADRLAYTAYNPQAEVVALGSPKIDRIVNLAAAQPPLPQSWQHLRGRKLFFLNSSVSSLLRWEDKYFAKLRALFELFAKRDDAGLIWRPHPLTKGTLAAMRPELLARYRELEAMVRGSDFGVLDESPDMGQVIALSDAYIGDGSSSLLYLYSLTGKPLYVLNFQMPIEPGVAEHQTMEQSSFFWGLLPDPDYGKAWGLSANVNALCEVDLETGRAQALRMAEGEVNTASRYSGPYLAGGKLLLAPALARNWAFYCPVAETWETLPLPPEYWPELSRHPAMGGGVVYEDKIVFLPGPAGVAACYDVQKESFSYYPALFREVMSLVRNPEWGIFSGCVLVGSSAFLASPQGAFVTELNLDTLTVTIHAAGSGESQFYGIAHDGQRFWLTKYRPHGVGGFREGIVCWDKETGSVTEYTGLPLQTDPRYEAGGLGQILYYEGYLYALPLGGDSIIRIDPEAPSFERYDLGLGIDPLQRQTPYHSLYDEVAMPAGLIPYGEGSLLTTLLYDYSLLVIDTTKVAGAGRAERRRLCVDGLASALRHPDLSEPYVYQESAFLTAGEYLRQVVSGEILGYSAERATYHRSVNVNSDGSCGQKVHEFVLGKLRVLTG
jgi:hypothetical protein